MEVGKLISIKNNIEVTEYIEKSKFISHAFPIKSEEEAAEHINAIKKIHYKATHNVYAYIIGTNQELQRSTDDGEPSGTAGVPILEIIKKENMTNVLIIVTRYFGGIKLGAGGLIRAYAHMAKLALDQSEKIVNILCESIQISIKYSHWGRMENHIKNEESIHISTVEFADKVTIKLYIEKKYLAELQNIVNEITNGEALIENLGSKYITLSV